MPSLNIEGRRVTVDDSFMKLSPDQQNDAVDEIATSLRSSGHLPQAQGQRQISMPSYDAMGNPTGAQENVTGEVAPRSSMRDQLDDLVKGFGGGLVRGAAQTAGLVTEGAPWVIQNLAELGERGVTALAGGDARDAIAQRRTSVAFPGVGDALSTRGIQRGIENVTGPAYQPQTRAGRFASAAGEFVPGAMIGGPANMARNVAAFGVVPGLLSEAGGQLFEGSAMETPARVAGGLVGGIGSAAAMRSNVAGNMVRNAVDGATPQQLEAAEQLFQRAQQAGQPISRAEAMQAVTNGTTGLGDLQHTIEGMGGMKPFYAARPAQNEAAARQAFDQIAPPSRDPSAIGRQIGTAAENTLDDVRGAINRQTRPLYRTAEAQRIDPQTFARVSRDPVFAEGLQRVRNDPWIGPTLEGLPDDSVQVIHAIKTQLDETGRNLRDPIAGTARNNYAGSIVDQGNRRIVQAADEATGSAPGIQGSYEAARTQQARLRERYLQPLLDGPIGKIANRDQTTKQAIEVLFQQKPLANSQDEIATAVSAVAQRNPWAARQLVRAHAEGTFSEATQRLASGGPNQSGGAKFAAVIRGNPQQAANLQAAVEALPNGDATWRGFGAFLDILDAQQWRQATGSRTAFKIEGVEQLRSGGLLNNASQMVASGGFKWPQKAVNAIQNWNVGSNLDDLARLLTDPAAAADFRRIATAPSGSNKAAALSARLAIIAANGRQPERGTVRLGG